MTETETGMEVEKVTPVDGVEMFRLNKFEVFRKESEARIEGAVSIAITILEQHEAKVKALIRALKENLAVSKQWIEITADMCGEAEIFKEVSDETLDNIMRKFKIKPDDLK